MRTIKSRSISDTTPLREDFKILVNPSSETVDDSDLRECVGLLHWYFEREPMLLLNSALLQPDLFLKVLGYTYIRSTCIPYYVPYCLYFVPGDHLNINFQRSWTVQAVLDRGQFLGLRTVVSRWYVTR